MSGITLAQAQTQLNLWLAADTAVASGQSYSIAGRQFSKIPIDTLRQMRGQYRQEVWMERNPGSNGPKFVIAFNAPGN